MKESNIRRLIKLRDPLLEWYDGHKRSLPWRDTKDPYRIWVSEIMLQQTRVDTVIPYYERFMRELPTVRDLATAKEEKLLKLWEGLGYYSRVRNMQKAAKQVQEEYGGRLPKDFEALRSLKGIGRYTAGAVASFAFGIPCAAVDGNVLRVISRINAIEQDIMKTSTKNEIEQEVTRVIPKKRAGDFNQGLIELGALVCVPAGEAKCSQCPAFSFCEAQIQGRIHELPVKSKGKERKKEKKTILVLRDDNRFVLRKRPDKGLLAGLFELPNIEGHLSPDEALSYVKGEGLSPIHITEMARAKHVFSHVEWDMIGYMIRLDSLQEQRKGKMIFVTEKELQNHYAVASAFAPFLSFL